MSFLKTKLWPVVAGFVVASIVMMIFEFINSFIFPIPADLDWKDPEAVRALTESLPWTAYILVLLGWAFGAYKGGWVTAYLSGEKKFHASLALAIILVLSGVLNVIMIGHDLVFAILGLSVLALGTYLGFWAVQKKWPPFMFRNSR
jgi:O-antigen/teichoic acid export membrane protein